MLLCGYLKYPKHSSYQGLYRPHKVIEQSVAFLGTKLRSSGISHTIQTLPLVQDGKERKASKW